MHQRCRARFVRQLLSQSRHQIATQRPRTLGGAQQVADEVNFMPRGTSFIAISKRYDLRAFRAHQLAIGQCR